MILGDDAERAAFLERYGALSGLPERSEGLSNDFVLSVAGTVGDPTFPGAVLPRADGRGAGYYAVAQTWADWRRLGPILTAFVGPTLSDFHGWVSAFEPRDDLERLLAAQGFAVVCPFSGAPEPRLQTAALRALARARTMLGRAPVPERMRLRPTYEVLAEHRWALVAGDRDRAAASVAYLRENMRLDALNLRFLEIKGAAALGDWQEIAERPDFDELSVARRPVAVTKALITALYRRSVEHAGPDPDKCLAAFARSCRPYVGSLLRVTPPDPDGPSLLMAALARASDWPPDLPAIEHLRSLAERIEACDEKETALGVLDRIAAPAGQAGSTVTSPVAAGAPDPDARLSVEGARTLLVTAAVTQVLADARTAVDRLSRLTTVELDVVLNTPGLRAIWRDLVPPGNAIPPTTWVEWLDALDKVDFERSAEWAEAAAEQWSVVDHLSDPRDLEALVDALGRTRSQASEEHLANALPSLVGWLIADARWPRPSFAPLYRRLTTLLLLGERRSAGPMSALATLFEGLLGVGLNAVEYADLMEDVRGGLGSNLGVGAIDWLLDWVEMTIVHPCPDTEARTRLWNHALIEVAALGARLSQIHIDVLIDLAAILGGSEVVEEVARRRAAGGPRREEAIAAADFGHAVKSVAIYTLTEAVGQRVAEKLTTIFPRLQVDISSEHVGSDRLRAMARNADLFVVCWQSAKHAATGFIQDHRPADRPLVYPQGRGTSSILRCTMEHLERTGRS